MTSIKNLGTVMNEVPGLPAVITVDGEPGEIKRIFIQAKLKSGVSFENTGALAEFNKVTFSTNTGSFSLSGPKITDNSAAVSFGPWLTNLLSRTSEEFWKVPDRVLYSNIRIEPGEKLRIEIFTNSQEVLGQRNSANGDAQKGDITYIVKAEIEDIHDDVKVDFAANTSQKEFEASELTDSGKTRIDVKTDGQLVQFVGVLVEKWVPLETGPPEVAAHWEPISETDNFGEFIITAGDKQVLGEDYLTLRTLSYSCLKYPTALPEGVFIHRILPNSFPYSEIYSPNFGINAADLKIYVKGVANNTVKYRFTVSAVAYVQLMKVNPGDN
jgi:hypothetical protein